MTSAGHHTMFGAGGAPSVFRYVALKIVATRSMRGYSSLSAWAAITNDRQIQISEVNFGNSSFSSIYPWPSNMTLQTRSQYNQSKRYQEPVLVSTLKTGEKYGQMFDGSTSTKVCNPKPQLANGTVLKEVGTDRAIYTPGQTVNRSYWLENFGCDNVLSPGSLVLDLSSSPLDISVYNKWRFYNCNDNANGTATTSRTWVEGEILGSTDLNTWWRLDVFNSLAIPDTNYAIAYTGSLLPRKGDIWSDLDLTQRDWTNGISVDNV